MTRRVYVSAPPAPSATVHAGQTAQAESTDRCTREVALDPGAPRTLRSEIKGQAGACPDRTRDIPCTVRAVIGSFMIRNIRGIISAATQYERSNPSRQGAANSKYLVRRLRSHERTSLGANLGATRANHIQRIRASMNNGEGRIRSHGPI
jgi:hypothetical protein